MANVKSETDRMKQAYAQAVCEVEAQINHWKGVKEDYGSVTQQLKVLPDKTTQNVMVPFGPLAFMPGKLIHTNELMVHLGDCWFADVTCKQGLKIVDHRLKTVNKNLEDLDKTLQNLVKKSEFTEELDNTGEDSAIEIKEEVSKDYVHPSRRKRISRVKEETSAIETLEPRPGTASCFNDEELIKRLDEMERLEEEEDQMLLDSGNSSTGEETCSPSARTPQQKPSSSTEKPQPAKEKRVSWKPGIVEGRNADSDDSDEATPMIIHFSHTPTRKLDKNKQTRTSKERFENPGEIGKYLEVNESTLKNRDNASSGDINPTQEMKNKPASILKSNTATPHDPSAGSSRPPSLQTALSETVVEHVADTAKPQEPTAVKQKRVSRFKSSRKR